jgi:Family of unknown function (DUF5694)
MRHIPIIIASLFLSTASQAAEPAFDPKSLRGSQEGPLTQVLTLGSAHLAQMEKKPTPQELDSLLDKLEAFKPDIITHEGLSGEQCDQLERYKARYPSVFDDYCWGTAEIEKSTLLTVPKAMEGIEYTLKTWPKSPTVAQRKALITLFLAANDRPSALLQWMKLEPKDRVAGAGLDQTMVAILESTSKKFNETIVIGVALALRLGHERIYAVDDHTADSIHAKAGEGYEPAIKAHWASNSNLTIPSYKLYKEAEKSVSKTGDYLSFFRVLNKPETQRVFIEYDFASALKIKGPERYGRQYNAWNETRNLRMVANVRAAFGNRPGARVLNIVGASHKGYYDAYLNMMSDVQIVDALDVLK